MLWQNIASFSNNLCRTSFFVFEASTNFRGFLYKILISTILCQMVPISAASCIANVGGIQKISFTTGLDRKTVECACHWWTCFNLQSILQYITSSSPNKLLLCERHLILSPAKGEDKVGAANHALGGGCMLCMEAVANCHVKWVMFSIVLKRNGGGWRLAKDYPLVLPRRR